MPHIPPLPHKEAPSEVTAVYEDFARRMSFPAAPNFILTQGHSPTVARGTWDAVRNVLVLGKIPRWIKEMMFVAISKDRKCQYCTSAHIACCRMLGVSKENLDGMVRTVDNIPDPKIRDMVQFAVKCSQEPQKLMQADYDKLRSHGLSTSEIMEIIGMSALAVYANIIADATAMTEDEMFGSL
jgi:uncharacterized peroxidase-related enzyme